MPRLPGTDLDVSALCLGGNVFGWTADEPTSFALLDRYSDATPSPLRPFVDTAESYGDGTSERILGAWMAARGNRDSVVVATKASPMKKEHPLAAGEIRAAAERSLRNLQTDRIDLYYAHYDDATTPLEETLTAFDELVQAGKVRHVAASNYSAARLTEALETSEKLGITSYAALQTHYNLMERPAHEAELREVAAAEGLGVLPYFALAKGFLTGKYRPGEQPGADTRAGHASVGGSMQGFLTDEILTAVQNLRPIADDLGLSMAQLAIAWVLQNPNVAAAIIGASRPEQVHDNVKAAGVELPTEVLTRIDEALGDVVERDPAKTSRG